MLPSRAVNHLVNAVARWVVEYLHAHLADEVSLTDLAAVANLSPFHFARMFKQTMGKPPHAFQRELRCERAKTLLGVTRLSITLMRAGSPLPGCSAQKPE